MSVQGKMTEPAPSVETDPLKAADPADPNVLVAKPGLLGRLRRLITVEPVIFTITFAYITAFISVRVNYLEQAVGESLNYTTQPTYENQSFACVVNKSDPEYILGHQVQAISSYWSLGFDVTSSVLMVFSSLFLGSRSERGWGRKLTLLIPVVGIMLSIAITLVVIMFRLPIPYFFISEVLRGLSGSLFTVFAISFAYISDVATKEQLSMRLILAEATLYVAGCVSQIGVGRWIKVAGFLPPLWLSLGVTACTVLYIAFWLEETRPRQNHKFSLCDQFNDVIQMFSNKPRGYSSRLTVISVAFFFASLTLTSYVLTILYVIAPPYCFDSVLIGYYQAFMFLAIGIGLLAGGKLLACCMGDIGIAQVSFLSAIGLYLMIAFAKSPIMILCAPFVGCLSSLSYPVLRGRMSKLVHPTEQGVMFSFFCGIQGVAQSISPLVYNNIYSSTVEFMPNAVYLLFAFTILIAVFLVGALQVQDCIGEKLQPLDPLMNDKCLSAPINETSPSTEDYGTIATK
ncbi:proton-coupled folate transporter-like isoform X2 [Ptychodera flava]|uniref:proton-coupled folate transporter-like isoform X2 n=1 Tax=Ptychodera flava TaxID=63121 RepID=UPI003969C723